MTKRRTDQNRKRRPDAWEIRANLTPDQLRQAFAWARSLGYSKAIGLIAANWHCKPPTTSSFSAWYSEFSRLDSEERVHRAIADASAIRELAAKTGDVSEAMLAALESEASAALLNNDPERIKLLVGLALKARAGRAQDKELALKVEAWEAQKRQNAEARQKLEGAVRTGGLDPDTLRTIEEAAKLL